MVEDGQFVARNGLLVLVVGVVVVVVVVERGRTGPATHAVMVLAHLLKH